MIGQAELLHRDKCRNHIPCSRIFRVFQNQASFFHDIPGLEIIRFTFEDFPGLSTYGLYESRWPFSSLQWRAGILSLTCYHIWPEKNERKTLVRTITLYGRRRHEWHQSATHRPSDSVLCKLALLSRFYTRWLPNSQVYCPWPQYTSELTGALNGVEGIWRGCVCQNHMHASVGTVSEAYHLRTNRSYHAPHYIPMPVIYSTLIGHDLQTELY